MISIILFPLTILGEADLSTLSPRAEKMFQVVYLKSSQEVVHLIFFRFH